MGFARNGRLWKRKGVSKKDIKKLVTSNYNRAEEVQDQYQATKVRRTTKGRRLRLRPVMRLQPESKFKLTQGSNGAVSTVEAGGWTVASLVTMQRGTDNENARIGDKIIVKSILSRLYVSMPRIPIILASDVDVFVGSAVCRVMLVYDRRSNGATVDLAKLFQTPNRILSPLNSDDSGRYKIIFDKIFTLVQNTENHAVLITQNNIFKNGMQVEYDANAGDITDVESGNFAIVYGCLPSTATALVATPVITYDFKINYQDL